MSAKVVDARVKKNATQASHMVKCKCRAERGEKSGQVKKGRALKGEKGGLFESEALDVDLTLREPMSSRGGDGQVGGEVPLSDKIFLSSPI